MTLRLGRLPHLQAAVDAAPSLHCAAEAPPPPTLDRTSISYHPQMFDNDWAPDCTVAALLNAALAVNALAGAGGLAIADGCWLPFYAALAGCAPTRDAIAATDGLVLLDVLRRQAVQGFDIGAVAPLTGDFGTVPLTRADLAAAMARLGCLYVGIDLAPDDMETSAPGVWDRGQPSQMLGHCVVAWSYTGLADTDLVTLATWGYLQCVTWRGFEARLREAYGLLLPGIEPPGVDVSALRAANRRWLEA